MSQAQLLGLSILVKVLWSPEHNIKFSFNVLTYCLFASRPSREQFVSKCEHRKMNIWVQQSLHKQLENIYCF